jgi:hypothetical protein
MAIPIFIIGMQRSGTNFLFWNLEKDKRFESYNEDNPKAFTQFRLTSPENTLELIRNCKKEYIVFKSISDSRVVDALLEIPNAKILWVLRDLESVVKSNVYEFGVEILEKSQKRLSRLVGKEDMAEEWNSDFCNSNRFSEMQNMLFGYMKMITLPADALALEWINVNLKYFIFNLQDNTNVKVVSYSNFKNNPEKEFSDISNFLGITSFVPTLEYRERIIDLEYKISPSFKMYGEIVKEALESSDKVKWNK